jgi:hypothetical protein
VSIGAAFRPWGWGYNRFAWNTHTVFVNNATWNRTYVNRTTYVHPYTVQRYQAPARMETHQLERRSEAERQYPRTGRTHVEEHRDEGHRR